MSEQTLEDTLVRGYIDTGGGDIPAFNGCYLIIVPGQIVMLYLPEFNEVDVSTNPDLLRLSREEINNEREDIEDSMLVGKTWDFIIDSTLVTEFLEARQ